MTQPPYPIREIYCPAHFGNSYEAMWPRDMAEYLAEMKWWGFNRYADWITATDVTNPHHTDALWSLGQEQLDRKRKAFAAAQSLGMGVNVVLTPNHVYLDQLRPEIGAKKGPRISGQLVCPSTAGGRQVILQNAEDTFRDLAEAGIRVNTLTASPYDYGGCACEKCNPWMLTFARLVKEIHAIAAKHHPGIDAWFCCWWWTADEHRQIAQWAAKEAPGWLAGMTLHVDYDQTRVPDVPLPEGCAKLAFFHNGYGDTRKFNDLYGKWGAVVAPARIPATLRDIGQQGARGFSAYSEGVFDDCNKALLGAMSSGKFATSDQVLEQYAKRYLGASDETAARWTKWLGAWGNRKNVALPEAAKELEQLSAGLPLTWRLEHWRSKVKLETLDRAIGTPAVDGWTAQKLKLVNEFWAEQERLNREVCRLGPMRHILAPRFAPPAWYDSWHQATGGREDQAGFHPGA